MGDSECRNSKNGSGLNVEEWRRYFQSWITRQRDAGEPPERIARYDRLLKDRTLDPVWIGLAKGTRPHGEPPSCDPLEALLQLAGIVGFPPDLIQPPTLEQVQPVLRALRMLDRAWHTSPSLADHLSAAVSQATGQPIPLPTTRTGVKALIHAIERIDWNQYQGPLMPATPNSGTANRNWLALYLRDAIIPAFFLRRHDAAIAELVQVAYPEWPGFSDGAKSVRELRERRLGKKRWGELVNAQGSEHPE